MQQYLRKAADSAETAVGIHFFRRWCALMVVRCPAAVGVILVGLAWCASGDIQVECNKFSAAKHYHRDVFSVRLSSLVEGRQVLLDQPTGATK